MKAFVLIIVLMIANNVYGANHSDLGKPYYTPEQRCPVRHGHIDIVT